MSKRVITTLFDDIDDTPIEDGAGETIVFALDGTSYEIDLSSINATKLRNSLAPFIAAARPKKTARPSSESTNRASASRRLELEAIRLWARSNGYVVSDRGRIAGSIVSAYRETAG